MGSLTGAAQATPAGAAAAILSAAAATGTNSASGPTSTGLKLFSTNAGVQFGTKIPSWVWYVAAGLATALVLKRLRK